MSTYIQVPRIENLDDLAFHTHLSKSKLYKLIFYADRYYRKDWQPKKTGGKRLIMAPNRELKAVQWWILRNILDRVPPMPVAKGFVRNQSILSNVLPHKQNNYFLCIDIEDFFPSIKYGRVFKVYETIGYNKRVAHMLTSLCTCEGVLPQGGVTSPSLSNLVCVRLDRRLHIAASKWGIIYTRYADDITFSSNRATALAPMKSLAEEILRDEGFKINARKTRFMGPARQRRITGLILGDTPEGNRLVGVGRQRQRYLRAAIHKLAVAQLSAEERRHLINHISGWLAYLHGVDPQRYQNLLFYIAKIEAKYDTKLEIAIPKSQ